jgi:hypothetical protein
MGFEEQQKIFFFVCVCGGGGGELRDPIREDMKKQLASRPSEPIPGYWNLQ